MGRQPLPLSPYLRDLSARMASVAAASGGVITAAQASAAGASADDLRALLRRSDWERVRRGVYAAPVGPAARRPFPVEHHRECAALLAGLGGSAGDVVVSHLSAVRLLGLPLPPRPDPRVVVTRRPPGSARQLWGAVVHVARCDDVEVVQVAGVPVLAGARLIIDCCATMPADSALAVADAVLRAGLATPEELADQVARHGRQRFARTAQRVAERADPLAENWFESSSRWWLLEEGLPRPTLQVPVADRFGQVQARVDMLMPGHWTVGEADGRSKYEQPGSLFAEKEREDWLREVHRLEVVRWTPKNMRSQAGRSAVAGRFERAFARARRLRRR